MDKPENHGLKSRNYDNIDEDIFDDSIFMENLESLDFKNSPNKNKDDGKSDLNVSALCCDEELNGYDKLTGQIWIYPTNYPVRDYQFNIIKAAMLENCLVSLPTGLGKTFIAAVIMYNFYRWYPLGKIIFTAPTRPLVAQQIEACYNIVAMPPKDTIEMTGQMQVNIRKVHWQSKRVFFATPQVIYNDIKSGMCPGDKIRCLVFDEAHKARGNYAYGNIISTLSDMGHKVYRVLALSATPGNKIEDVIHVVKHLHISHLELRTENCQDVKQYSQVRKINTVVVELGPELSLLRQKYVEILDGYTRKLKNFNIVQNLGNLSKGRIVMLYKEFQSRARGARHPQHNYIMRTFTLLITLYHGLELLVKHGARVFLNFFDEHPEKTWVHFDNDLTTFFDKLRDQLGVNPLSFDRSVLPDGTIPEIPKNLNFGHPKFEKLRDIMLEHFKIAKQDGKVTKAIVFCEYRESVNLVHCLLLQCRPTIQPEMFVGHGSSKEGKTAISQKQQLRVMRKFRSGSCNTLVCTCVAEEGLDVGAVDLILCFDVSTRSPVRLVQRCGRTGRERSGQVFILVTEGREHSTLLDCMRQNEGLNKRILQSEEVKKNLYKFNHRMLPRDFMPECQKMFITVKNDLNEKSKKSKEKPKEKSKEKIQKGQQDLRNMFLNKASSSKMSQIQTGNNEMITEREFNKVFPKGYRECNFFTQPTEYWTMSKESLRRDNKEEPFIKLSSNIELQRNLQDTYSIGHSSDTLLLTELLQNKQEVPLFKSPMKKDGDIRVLFSKTTKSIKSYTKSMKELGINNNLNISQDILNLLVDISLDNNALVKNCYICLSVCNCTKFANKKLDNFKGPAVLCSRSQPLLPDINLIDNINPESLLEIVSNDINITMDTNKSINDLSESRLNLEHSTNVSNYSNVQDVEMDQDVLINTKTNHNVCDEDFLLDDSDIFDNINIPVKLTPTKSRLQLEPNQTVKRFDNSVSSLKTGNENNNDNVILHKKPIIVETEKICNNTNIFENHDFFEDDMPMKLAQTTSITSSIHSDNIQTCKRIAESIVRHCKTGNNIPNTKTELEDDTIIIESQEMFENDIFEDNDVLEHIDMPIKLTPTDSRPSLNTSNNIDTCRRIAESIIQQCKSENNNNKTKTELEDDIIVIENQEICEKNNIFEDNDVFVNIDIPVKIKLTESKPPINQLDTIETYKKNAELIVQGCGTRNNNANTKTELEDDTIIIESQDILDNADIFENNDFLEDVDMPIKLTPTESRTSLNTSNNIDTCRRIAESIIQQCKSENNNNKTKTELEDDIIVIENQEICEKNNIFEDNDVFVNIDIPVKIKITESKPPINKLDTIETYKRNAELTVQGCGTRNNNANTKTELEDDTIIIESQEILDNADIFENNDFLEDVDMPIKLTPTESRTSLNTSNNIETCRRIAESIIQQCSSKNKNNKTKIELKDDTIINESHEIWDDDNMFEDIDIPVQGTSTESRFGNSSINIENQRVIEDFDIFEEDDIFDDIETRNNRTCTKSKLEFNNIQNDTERNLEPTIQEVANDNDMYTVSVLKYFRLNRVFDIFQDLNIDIVKKDKVCNDNEKNVSLLPQMETMHNKKCYDNDPNEINGVPVERPSSPSLLSGRCKSDRSTSPILVSQKRKINLSIKKRQMEKNGSVLSDNKPSIYIPEKNTRSLPMVHQKTVESLQQNTNEIIVLDSDDDCFDNNPKKIEKLENTKTKRKFNEEPNNKSESPYFCKKLKLNENNPKPSTIKEKIIAALTSHQNPGNSFQNNTQINFMMTKSPTFKIKKENIDPDSSDEINKKSPKCNIDMLKRFQHKTINKSKAMLYERTLNVPSKINFDDDDDFETKIPFRKKILSKLKKERIRNNAKKFNEFLDVEAELSQENSASADERSDDSVGSLVDFICDEAPSEDIHDIYLQSVKSPVKGVFKVPKLPPLNKDEVFSQYVEEDTYEMDSFCVDSHMILNETHEMSELEIGEMILKERRKRKKIKNQSNKQQIDEGSPIIRKNYRNIKRQIDSDSEDSS